MCVHRVRETVVYQKEVGVKKVVNTIWFFSAFLNLVKGISKTFIVLPFSDEDLVNNVVVGVTISGNIRELEIDEVNGNSRYRVRTYLSNSNGGNEDLLKKAQKDKNKKIRDIKEDVDRKTDQDIDI